jgi:hypothetical protein
MTPEEQKAAEEEIIRFQQENPDYWGDQDENGVDLAHLRENLPLTPAERLDKHGIAFALAMKLKDGIERSRTTQKSSPSL